MDLKLFRISASLAGPISVGLVALATHLAGCTERPQRPQQAAATQVPADAPRKSEGTLIEVSWYGADFAGQATASGEPFDPEDLTIAHRTLPLGTRVRITNPENGKSVVARVNDRGPYVKGRTADLSRAVARRLGLIEDGTGQVRLQVLAAGDGQR